MSASRVVHVDIHGSRYAVRSDLDPQYIGELAAFIDDRMQAAARELASADPLRVAILAALNIADDLYRAKRNADGVGGELLARAAEIEQLVDAVLGGARIRAAVNT